MVFGYQSSRHPLHQLRDEMDRLLMGVFGPAADGFLPAMFRSQPAVNVWEQDDALKIEMELPGVKREQIDISATADELSIKVNCPESAKCPEAAEENVKYHRRERPIGAFSRALRLPVEVDADRVEAELHDGVLTITLPKAAPAKRKRVEVKEK